MDTQQWIVPGIASGLGVLVVVRRILAYSALKKPVGGREGRRQRAAKIELVGMLLFLLCVVPFVLLVLSPLRFIVIGVAAIGLALFMVGRTMRRVIELTDR